MTSRERVLAAIQHKVPDRIPVDAIYIENDAEIRQFLNLPLESDVRSHLGIDGRCVAAWKYTGQTPASDGKAPTPWGVEENNYGTDSVHPLGDASLQQVESFQWPDPHAFDFEELDKEVSSFQGEFAIRGPYWVSAPLFCTTCSLMGMEEALCKMLVEGKVFEACVEKIFEFSHAYVEKFLEVMGPRLDILYLADDFAGQRGLLMDPMLWRKYLKPRYEKLFALGKKRGLPVWFHSCGDITSVITDLIDIGMDVWETVQLHTLPISAQELKKNYGHLVTFFGGINTQRLPYLSPREVAGEVYRCVETLAEGGGYICGPDHHIKQDVPAANAIALFESAIRFARQGYTRA